MHRSCAANSEHSVECLTPDSLDHFELETFLNPVPQMCGIYSPWTDNWQIWNCHYSYHNAEERLDNYVHCKSTNSLEMVPDSDMV